MGQVGTWILRWNGITEDFQEECYNVPDIVQDEFQAVQGQIAWVTRRGQDTSDHLAFVEHKLKSLWVQVHLEQKYLRHLIKEHVLYLQSSNSSSCCQCPILGPLPLSPALQETPLSPFGRSSTPSSRQRCHLSNKKVARRMKLKIQMRKLLKKNGRTLVREMMEEVAREERVMHDVFGCEDCFVDPHNGHVSYCPLSVYNPFHPSHLCLGGVPCSCDSYLADHDSSY